MDEVNGQMIANFGRFNGDSESNSVDEEVGFQDCYV
jgi:hypothetical protein